MSIWFLPTVKVEDLQPLGAGTMGDYLGIVFTELGEDYLKATMPVDHRTKQVVGGPPSRTMTPREY